MNSDPIDCSGEFWFCRFKTSGTAPTGWAVQFNQFQNAEAIYWERCTIEGPIFARKVVTATGPFTFRNCVIVNADGGQSPWPFFQEEAPSGGPGAIDNSRVVAPGGLSPTGTE